MKKNVEWVCSFFIEHRKKLIIMRNAVIVLLISAFQVLASGSYSQTAQLSIKLKGATIKEVLNEIEEQSEFYFMYNSELINVTKKVDISVKNEKVDKVLSRLFDKNEVDVLVKDRYIVLVPSKESTKQMQQKTVSGVVKDETGQPLMGVTIIVKGTTNGTVTNGNGSYSLNDIAPQATLVFSFIGLQTQEIEVGNQTVINVTMRIDAIGIEEVVAIGYGVIKKSDLTGSVSSIKSDDLERVPVLGLDMAMQGRATGVYVANNNANPGGAVNIRIRGTNSIQGDNEPLYVIDGYVGGSINSVNPSDIESIEILKDASSTAIYGARGANGVVIVTTKGGKPGKNTLNVDMFYGWQTVRKKLDMMGAVDYANFINAIDADRGNELTYANPNSPEYDTDWQDVLLRTAPWQQYTISGNGGTDKLSFYLSGSYTNQQGIEESTGYERYNIRANIDAKISDRITFGTRLGLSRIDRTRQTGEEVGRLDDNTDIGRALNLQPTITAYDEMGNALATIIDASDLLRGNPLFDLQNNIQKQFSSNFTGNLFTEIKLLEHLKFRTSFGFNIINLKQNKYKPSTSYGNTTGYRNSANIGATYNMGWLNENYFTYNQQFENHSLQLTGGATFQGNDMESVSIAISDFAIDDFTYNNLAAGSTVGSYDSGMSQWRQASFFGRIHYTINDKYLITLNGRYDGSSKFGIDNKWAFFPSGAVAWRLSEEDFIKELGTFSSMKLRASYGISGSEALGPYKSLAVMDATSSAYVINDVEVVGYYPSRLPNPDLRWEETTQLDVGLDFGVLNGRVNFVMDYYNKTTNNLFLNKPVPQTSGVSSVQYNIGSLRNSGFELGINSTLVSRGDFTWQLDLNGNYQQSEILDLGDEDEIITGFISGSYGDVGNIQIMKVGEPLGAFYGFKTDGVWGTDDDLTAYTQFGTAVEPGDMKLVNITDEEGVAANVNDDDRQILGYSQPKFYGGFNNSFSYKGLDLSLFFQIVVGTKVLNASAMRYRNTGTYGNKVVDLKNYWTPDNQNTDIPRAGSIMPVQVVDTYLEDGSFLRLREITFGYSFPPSMLNKVNISKLRFYVTGSNLLTFTKYSGYDPEVNIAGGDIGIINFDNGSYPRAKSVILGLNLTF